MSMVTQAYQLDIIPFGPPVIVPVSQYDVGARTLSFTLYNGQSSVFTIPSGATAVIGGTKPDGKAFNYVCTIDGNVVSCDVTEQMTAVAGFAECEIAIMQGDDRLATANFKLHVEQAALDESKVSDSDLAAMPDLMNRAAASASAAATSEKNAKTSETNAKTSETNAKSSETAASKSQSAAKTSETNAKSSETAAGKSASAAATSETNAKTSETNAGESASAAATSEKNAATSEKNAKTSETNAAKSESNAKDSETSASGSASAAALSQSAAKTSEDNAAASAAAAAESAQTAASIAGVGEFAYYISSEDQMLHFKYQQGGLTTNE